MVKYTESSPPLVCMQTTSDCYRGTEEMKPLGVLWHSTGSDNPWLKRYVQPSDDAPDREQMLKILGINTNGNDWNHISRDAGLNAWVGRLEDGTVSSVQTMPWNFAPWGCGSGEKGSCNRGWIQFEICEDDLSSPDYFREVYQESVELTAWICRLHGMDPMGTVSYAGEKLPVILCHQDSFRLGLGSDHSDIYHWFSRYGKDMDDVRADVMACMKGEEDNMTEKETTNLIQKLVPDIVRAVLAEESAAREQVPSPGWASEAVRSAMDHGITDGSRLQAYATRMEAAIMADRARQDSKDPA